MPPDWFRHPFLPRKSWSERLGGISLVGRACRGGNPQAYSRPTCEQDNPQSAECLHRPKARYRQAARPSLPSMFFRCFRLWKNSKRWWNLWYVRPKSQIRHSRSRCSNHPGSYHLRGASHCIRQDSSKYWTIACHCPSGNRNGYRHPKYNRHFRIRALRPSGRYGWARSG